MDNDTVIDFAERIAVLETKWKVTEERLESIDDKLGELLELKHKGMGAISLIGLIVGSGLIGLITIIIELFNKPHL